MLKDAVKLKELDLTRNDLGKEAGLAIASAVNQNLGIKSVSLLRNRIRRPEALEIRKRDKRGVIRIDIPGCSIF